LIDILNEINNPYLVIYDDVFMINNFTIALVGEYFEVKFFNLKNSAYVIEILFLQDGNMEKIIKKMIDSKKCFSEEKVFDLIYYLTDGLKFLHERKILHKEIKPRYNFLNSIDLKN
jgi:serine/threonine protein kinase